MPRGSNPAHDISFSSLLYVCIANNSVYLISGLRYKDIRTLISISIIRERVLSPLACSPDGVGVATDTVSSPVSHGCYILKDELRTWDISIARVLFEYEVANIFLSNPVGIRESRGVSMPPSTIQACMFLDQCATRSLWPPIDPHLSSFLLNSGLPFSHPLYALI